MRRMFAGGRTRHLAPLRIGAPAVRRAEVVRRTEKQGRSGPLTFVSVHHTIEQDGRTAVLDDQDIVYRLPAEGQPAPDRAQSSPPPENGHGPDFPPDGRGLVVDPVLLFRFSALTYNAHRIHYDRPYAATEGYPDLVIHGPLQILLMAECLRDARIELTGRTFEYRLLKPAVGPQRLTARLVADQAGGEALIVSGSVSGRVATARVAAS
jgi:3-methylfumaryl-CoA hydratase